MAIQPVNGQVLALVVQKKESSVSRQARRDRRAELREEVPDAPDNTIPRCGYCGLRWHDEQSCDLKERRRTMSYIGCVLSDAI